NPSGGPPYKTQNLSSPRRAPNVENRAAHPAVAGGRYFMAAYDPDHHNPDDDGILPNEDATISAQSYIDQGNKAIEDGEYDIAAEPSTPAAHPAPDDPPAH